MSFCFIRLCLSWIFRTFLSEISFESNSVVWWKPRNLRITHIHRVKWSNIALQTIWKSLEFERRRSNAEQERTFASPSHLKSNLFSERWNITLLFRCAVLIFLVFLHFVFTILLNRFSRERSSQKSITNTFILSSFKHKHNHWMIISP